MRNIIFNCMRALVVWLTAKLGVPSIFVLNEVYYIAFPIY